MWYCRTLFNGISLTKDLSVAAYDFKGLTKNMLVL